MNQKPPHQLLNSGYPVPPQDAFKWAENQRVEDIPTLQFALRAAAKKLCKAETPTPKEPFSALKGRALDEGAYVFTADVEFWNKDHAIIALQEIATQIGTGQTDCPIGEGGSWSLRLVSDLPK